MRLNSKKLRALKILSFIIITAIFLTFFAQRKLKENQHPVQKASYLNELSEDFLQNIKNGKATHEIETEFANLNLPLLLKQLDTDSKKIAFWLNVYNGYILTILSKKPELYNDKRAFFSKKQIPFAGDTISFEKIEHGIIRKSQWGFGLGYVRKWFPNQFERKLRVQQPDYRIHFALNCGAKDCPPVAIYSPEKLEAQLSKSAQLFLESKSEYVSDTKTVKTTSLFNWFRGDFGGKSGVKKILKKHQIIPTEKGVKLEYQNYDWTLLLNNFIEL